MRTVKVEKVLFALRFLLQAVTDPVYFQENSVSEGLSANVLTAKFLETSTRSH